MIGKTISHYKILEKLGEGGMGVVYKAEDTKLGRTVAIKFLPRNIATTSEERERFKIEAKAAAALNHPNIAHIYAIEETDSEMFIVMEYIDGIELNDKIKSGRISADVAIDITIQIAEGLGAAHKKGIVHRDIKSSNIMVTSDGKVKIMDFGLAKVKGGSEVTKIGATVGTISYMSPEQAKGENVDHRTDIWSLGVVLYEMLAGKMPFIGDYDQAIIYSILNEEPEPVNEIHEGLKHIIIKSLAKNPNDRYQTAGEIADELHTISEGGMVKRTVKKSKLPWMIAGATVILIAAVYYFLMPSSNNVEEKDKNVVKTIAVLPFRDVSPNTDQEYFSDGLSEELLNVLVKNPQLRVTSRTSAFSFKGTNTDIKTIAAKLNVEHILEGSVRKAGNELRIMAQLIDVKTDALLWSETYDGTLENIFTLQDSISGSVAEALKITLLGKESATQQRETDPQAYNAYLLGKHFYNLRGKENFEKAARHYQQALLIDSGYAPAWVGLSQTHIAQAESGYLPEDEGYHKARQEAEKSLELDPKLADAHSNMGWIKRRYEWDWDWNGMDESFRRALELEPGSARVVSNAAVLAYSLGRLEEAITLGRRSIELDPLRIAGYLNLGFYTWYAGLLDESETAFRKCLDLNSQVPGAHTGIGLVYLEKGRPDSALAEMEKETRHLYQIYGFALSYYALGKKKDGNATLADFIKDYQDRAAYQIAEIYAYRGETDKSFEWLERAYLQRDAGLTTMRGNPLLRNIEKDPRYTVFIKKLKLPL
jgi:serine/threonine protein kinase